MVRLMRLGRTCTELDGSTFFHVDEIRGVFLLVKKPPPKPHISLNQFICLIALLRPFLGHKSDGELGAKTLWFENQRMDAAHTI
jgi:hypothetical protein